MKNPKLDSTELELLEKYEKEINNLTTRDGVEDFVKKNCGGWSTRLKVLILYCFNKGFFHLVTEITKWGDLSIRFYWGNLVLSKRGFASSKGIENTEKWSKKILEERLIQIYQIPKEVVTNLVEDLKWISLD